MDAQDTVGIDVQLLDDIQTRMLALYASPANTPSAIGSGSEAQMRESIANFCHTQVCPGMTAIACAPLSAAFWFVRFWTAHSPCVCAVRMNYDCCEFGHARCMLHSARPQASFWKTCTRMPGSWERQNGGFSSCICQLILFLRKKGSHLQQHCWMCLRCDLTPTAGNQSSAGCALLRIGTPDRMLLAGP